MTEHGVDALVQERFGEFLVGLDVALHQSLELFGSQLPRHTPAAGGVEALRKAAEGRCPVIESRCREHGLSNRLRQVNRAEE